MWRTAQRKAEARKHGLEGNHRKPAELWWRIEQMIEEEDWSPSQIAGVLRKEGIHIAIQTIYNHVHADASGRLAKHMPHELKYTKRVKATRPTKATNMANRTSIHDRPKGGRHTLRRLKCRSRRAAPTLLLRRDNAVAAQLPKHANYPFLHPSPHVCSFNVSA